MTRTLEKSPIFNLSMASKELFHSNMLYWISREYPFLFEAILKKLGIDTSLWPKYTTSYREKDYFDLSIVEDNNSIFLAGQPSSICIAATDLPLLTRNSYGNIMIKSNISSIVKI